MSRAAAPAILHPAKIRAAGPETPGSATNRLPPSGCGERAVVMNSRLPANQHGGHIVGRDLELLGQLAFRAVAPHLRAAVEREPDAALVVDDEPVGHADALLDRRERAAVGDLAVVVHDVDPFDRRVDVVHAVAVPVEPVGERQRREHRGELAARVAVQRALLPRLVLGHRPDPEAPVGVDGAVVGAQAGVGVGEGDEILELAAGRGRASRAGRRARRARGRDPASARPRRPWRAAAMPRPRRWRDRSGGARGRRCRPTAAARCARPSAGPRRGRRWRRGRARRCRLYIATDSLIAWPPSSPRRSPGVTSKLRGRPSRRPRGARRCSPPARSPSARAASSRSRPRTSSAPARSRCAAPRPSSRRSARRAARPASSPPRPATTPRRSRPRRA